MTDLSLERPLQPSLLPPLATLPAPGRLHEPDALAIYLPTTRAWHRRPVVVPTSVVVALWVVLGGAGAVGGWLLATRSAPGSGLLLRIATLGHPGLLVILAGICVATLLALAPFTRGLTRAGGPELAAMTLAGIAGTVSLFGVMVVAALAVLVGFLTLAAAVAVFEPN